MKISKKLIISVLFIVFNIILLIILYISIKYPVENKYEGNGNGKTINNITGFYSYDTKSYITLEQKEIVQNIVNENILDSEFINWNKEVETKININFRHSKVFGWLTFLGTYDSIDNLKEALKEIDIDENEWNKMYINIVNNSEPEITAYIRIKENNIIELCIGSRLPYKYNINEINNEENIVKYFINTNEEFRKKISNETDKANKEFLFWYFIINIVYISIIYIYYKKVNVKSKKIII